MHKDELVAADRASAHRELRLRRNGAHLANALVITHIEALECDVLKAPPAPDTSAPSGADCSSRGDSPSAAHSGVAASAVTFAVATYSSVSVSVSPPSHR